MRTTMLTAIALMAFVGPAFARSHRPVYWMHARTYPRIHAWPKGGIPITVGDNTIRVDSVGQVISSEPRLKPHKFPK